MFLIGGYEEVDTYVSHSYSYNGQWTQIPNLIRARAGHRSVIFDNAILHIGGYNQDGDGFKM